MDVREKRAVDREIEERLTWWRAVNDRVGQVESFTAERGVKIVTRLIFCGWVAIYDGLRYAYYHDVMEMTDAKDGKYTQRV